MRPSRLVVVALVALVAASACRTTFVRRGSYPTATPVPTFPRRTAAAEPPAEPRTTGSDQAPAGGDGSFVLRVRDQNGATPAGIRIEIGGPVTRTLVTDADGRAVLDGPPGDYTWRIEATCDGATEVLRGASGRLGIAAGPTGDGETTIVWRSRFAPSAPVFASVHPVWPVGEVVRLRYDVDDRCNGHAPAPDALYASHAFETSDNLEVVGDPSLRSDADAYGWVEVRCTAPGSVTLEMFDGRNPPDRFDLVANAGGSAVGDAPYQEPSCGE